MYSLLEIFTKLQNKWFEFTKSILYYPILFLIGSFLLFILTSKLDPLIPRDYELFLFNPLVFTGSPDAARSILSTIATGWTTILGVAFSVTLITLQLSSSKYISRLVTEFQNDKINQLTLGWFLFVSSYSLLILKTVRTEDAEGIYIPILGTNIALIVAIIGLLIFILYIHNISNYLRPNILISHLIESIMSSLQKYEKRKTDKKLIFDKKLFGNKIFSIKAPNTGIITAINWEKIQHSLIRFHIDKDLWMEWYKSVGDWVGQGEILAILYEYIREDKYSPQKKTSKAIDTDNLIKNNNKDNDTINNKISSIYEQIANSIHVTKDSNLAEDPLLGIKLLGEMALKSNYLRDYDVVNSLIGGLFRILIFAYSNEEKLGLPFTISSEDMRFNKIRKINLVKKDKDKHTNLDNSEIDSKDTNHQMVQEKDQDKNKKVERVIIINPRELKIQDVILHTLTNISNAIIKQSNTSSNEYICKQYISTSNFLLEKNKVNEFHVLTQWYSNRLIVIKNEFSDSILLLPILNLLLKFKEDINVNYAFASKTFSIFMEKMLSFRDDIIDRRDIN